MYKLQKIRKTTLLVNTSYQGETLEEKIRRIVNNNEPTSDGAPLVYTDRKDGVLPEYNIRTDRFEVAVEAMDKVSKAHQAKRGNLSVVKDDDKGITDDKREGKTEGKTGESEGKA